MNIHKNFLLIEDEPNVALTLKERLVREGYQVAHATNIKDALQLVVTQKFVGALVDVGLPDGSGFSIAKHIRQSQPGCAVIFLTAFADPEYRVRGLELGAEDYIVKPFHLKELILRVNKACKRAVMLSGDSLNEELQLGKARVHLTKFEVSSNEGLYTLSHKECAVLKFLIDKRGKVVSRDEILNAVWSDDEYPTPRTIDNFIVKLRRLIELDANRPILIKSIRGVGYQLAEEDKS